MSIAHKHTYDRWQRVKWNNFHKNRFELFEKRTNNEIHSKIRNESHAIEHNYCHHRSRNDHFIFESRICVTTRQRMVCFYSFGEYSMNFVCQQMSRNVRHVSVCALVTELHAATPSNGQIKTLLLHFLMTTPVLLLLLPGLCNFNFKHTHTHIVHRSVSRWAFHASLYYIM